MAQASVEPGVEGSHFCREACRWGTAQAEFAGREEEASWQNSGGSVVQSHPWLYRVNLRPAWAT